MTTSIIDIPSRIEVQLTHDYAGDVQITHIDINSDIEFESCLEIEVNGNSTSVDATVEVSAYDVEQALDEEVQAVTFSIAPAEFLAVILKEVRTEINQARGVASYHERKKAGENIDKPLEELDPIDDKTFSAVVAKMLAPVVTLSS